MKTNIVLIGLTGCGKSTIGKKLSSILNMPFFDTDKYIEEHYGSIESLFKKGEEHFRDIESEAVEIISKRSNAIISTGGGVVLRRENMEALKNNGIVFYLVRPLEEIIRTLDTGTRPLLKNGTEALYKLHEQRKGLYMLYSDHIIDASDIDKAVNEIISILNSGA